MSPNTYTGQETSSEEMVALYTPTRSYFADSARHLVIV
jgi:hypothetical protein